MLTLEQIMFLYNHFGAEVVINGKFVEITKDGETHRFDSTKSDMFFIADVIGG